ncbi:hypothetical protein ANCDUO_20465 [Ancylostoma duodenale]|uniref:Uncharacterized protein n=1 Tax=Ancylostoma duodenale TaxID=51022 RepID=A0A0C2FLJ3_9BILA|nr:hypothetical protein ANCDUO_20465 [Ancylostoma duodenale]
MLPHALSSYDTLAFNDNFRFFYLKSKQHIAAVANWMSAAAIWSTYTLSSFRVRLYIDGVLQWEPTY